MKKEFNSRTHTYRTAQTYGNAHAVQLRLYERCVWRFLWQQYSAARTSIICMLKLFDFRFILIAFCKKNGLSTGQQVSTMFFVRIFSHKSVHYISEGNWCHSRHIPLWGRPPFEQIFKIKQFHHFIVFVFCCNLISLRSNSRTRYQIIFALIVGWHWKNFTNSIGRWSKSRRNSSANN